MPSRALCLLREDSGYRKDAFCRGLAACGYAVAPNIRVPRQDDVLVIWNRYGYFADRARQFESAGARVVVVENGYLGKSWRGETWFSMALGHHAGAGEWLPDGPRRWDSLGVELASFREGGEEVLVLGQRGIGEPGIASPRGWESEAKRRTGGRVRIHPATRDKAPPLEEDLANARACVTWASAAALHALMLGVPVFYGFAQWIGAGAALPLSQWPTEPKRDEAARLAMFQRLAWSIWRLPEIESGAAFAHVLGPDSRV